MKRKSLPTSDLSAWSRLNGVELDGAVISDSDGKGLGIFASKNLSADDHTLITVPKALVLSLETVWDHAKSDHHLHEVLTALGEFGKVAINSFKNWIMLNVQDP
jgi:hypothetical protein